MGTISYCPFMLKCWTRHPPTKIYIYATVISRIFKIQELEIKSVKLSIWLSIKFNCCVDQINCTLNSRTSVLMSTKNCKKFIPSIKANCLLPKSFSVHFIFHLVLVLWLVLSHILHNVRQSC
uniref:Uncharacterized protein n=1 Tax=Cacopsylla melanoneura TaxID=428564 RepID=A0A8D8LCT6_9HEMI